MQQVVDSYCIFSFVDQNRPFGVRAKRNRKNRPFGLRAKTNRKNRPFGLLNDDILFCFMIIVKLLSNYAGLIDGVLQFCRCRCGVD